MERRITSLVKCSTKSLHRVYSFGLFTLRSEFLYVARTRPIVQIDKKKLEAGNTSGLLDL
jgi:hypothetical protein